MSKLVRKNMKIFGQSATAGQIGVFGSFASGTPQYSTDPETIQNLSEWLDGWYSAVDVENAPCIQDMNAAFFVFAYQIAYLMQMGVAEWNSATTYYIGSVANDSSGQLYYSITDNNLNHALTDTNNWAKVIGTEAVVTKTADYTLTKYDSFVRMNGTGAAITATLPSTASTPMGKKFIIKNVSTDGSAITISSSDGIDGASSYTLYSSPILESLTVINNGSSYDIV